MTDPGGPVWWTSRTARLLISDAKGLETLGLGVISPSVPDVLFGLIRIRVSAFPDEGMVEQSGRPPSGNWRGLFLARTWAMTDCLTPEARSRNMSLRRPNPGARIGE